MNPFLKKVSYFTLGGLVCSASLTACVDNDEPYGIEQIRVSLAELLKSKSGLAEAEAAYTLAKAEVEKANAEYVKALAAVQNALAAGEQAKADEAAANAKKALALAELAITNANIEIEKAQAEWEIQKAQLDSKKVEALKPYYNAYFNALTKYNTEYDNYLKALKGQLDLTGGEYDAMANAQAAVETAKKNVSADSIAVAVAEEAVETAKNAQPSEIKAAYDSYQEQLKQIEAQRAALEVELSKVELNNPEAFAALKAAEAAYKNDVTIKQATWTPSQELMLLAPSQVGKVVLPENGDVTYTLANPANYKDVVAKYNAAISNVQGLFLDNGKEWTQVQLNNIKAEEAELQKKADAATKVWQSSVDFFKNGKASDLLGQAGVDDAVTAYNAAAKLYNDTVAVIVAANAKLAAAQEALSKTEANKLDSINNVYNVKSKQAKDAYLAAVKANAAEYQAVIDANDAAIAELENNVVVAQDRFDYLTKLTTDGATDDEGNALVPSPSDFTALTNAEIALDKAKTALENQKDKNSAALDKAVAAQDKANTAAWKECQASLNEYLAEQLEASLGVSATTPTAAKTAYDEALKAQQEASKAIDRNFNAINKAYTAIVTARGKQNADNYGVSFAASTNMNGFTVAFNKAMDAVQTAVYKDANAPEAVAANCSYFGNDNAKALVAETSRVLYGAAVLPADGDRFEAESVRLVPMTKEEAINLYKLSQGITSTVTNIKLDIFGAMGKVWSNQQSQELATAALNDPDLINKAVAGLQANLKVVTDAYAAQEAKKAAVDEAQAAVDALEKPIQDQIDALDPKEAALNKVVTAYTTNYPNINDSDEYPTAESIQANIEQLEKDLASAQDQLAEDTKKLARAEYLLSQAEQGKDIDAEISKFDVEKAKAQVEAAKTAVETTKAALDAAIEKLGNVPA